jgi:hypothetical protein
MNRFVCVPLLLAAFAGTAAAQTGTGSWELSLSSTLGTASQSTETEYGGRTTTHDGESQGYLSLALRPGFFVVNGLSIEPEFFWTAVEKVPPTFSMSGNVSYTFLIKESPVSPFLLAGYGVGNGIPLFQRLFLRSSDEMDITVLNLGAGVKVFLSEAIAFRAEYRYQRFAEETSYPAGPTYRRTSDYHNLLLGFSVFLHAD